MIADGPVKGNYRLDLRGVGVAIARIGKMPAGVGHKATLLSGCAPRFHHGYAHAPAPTARSPRRR